MPVITLPEGHRVSFAHPITAYHLAKSIGRGLARAAVAACVNGRLVDLCVEIDEDATVTIITAKSAAGLEIIRHSCAHLIGHAVKQLFPQAKMAIGPVIENGFYYDIDCDETFTETTLERIEERMKSLASKRHEVVREVVDRGQAVKVFTDRAEPYKVDIAQRIPENETIALYHHEEYTDMCRGPHVPNTSFLKAFKLTKLAGAYWRGDSSLKMLQRIYGCAWSTADELRAYLASLEDAKKRDHRRLGKQMQLFHFQQQSPGMVFWHQRGWQLFQTLESFIREQLNANGYQEICTPQVLDRSLWEASGHWDKFSDMMFVTHSEKRDYAIKPMNCPAHVQIFNQRIRSYRDLPLRLAEFGVVHRNEPSGTLHGLMRARCFTQDDAHIFCAPNQLFGEIDDFIKLTLRIYRYFGFRDVSLAFSTRPAKCVGSDQQWDEAEAILQKALADAGIDYLLQPGEGAFYGPKIEFTLKDSLGRSWQCGTVQVDFSMPLKLGATFVTETGKKQAPVMLHRAILGSLERFIGILIEDSAGFLPFWLSPVQLAVATISEKHIGFAQEVITLLKQRCLRAIGSLTNDKIGYKIREHWLLRVPYVLVIGDREVKSRSVSVRSAKGKDLGLVPLPGLEERLMELEKDSLQLPLM